MSTKRRQKMKEIPIEKFHTLNKKEKEGIMLLLASSNLSNYLHRKEPEKWHIIEIKSVRVT